MNVDGIANPPPPYSARPGLDRLGKAQRRLRNKLEDFYFPRPAPNYVGNFLENIDVLVSLARGQDRPTRWRCDGEREKDAMQFLQQFITTLTEGLRPSMVTQARLEAITSRRLDEIPQLLGLPYASVGEAKSRIGLGQDNQELPPSYSPLNVSQGPRGETIVDSSNSNLVIDRDMHFQAGPSGSFTADSSNNFSVIVRGSNTTYVNRGANVSIHYGAVVHFD